MDFSRRPTTSVFPRETPATEQRPRLGPLRSLSKERSGEESTRRRERGEELKLLVSELNTVVSACLQASCTDLSPLQQQLADARCI